MPDLSDIGNRPEDNDNSLRDQSNLAELLANGEQTSNKSKSKSFQYKTFGDHQAMRVCFEILKDKFLIFIYLESSSE